MFTDYKTVEILGKVINEDKDLEGYVVTVPDFGIQVVTERMLLSFVKKNSVERLVYKDGEMKLRNGMESFEYMNSLPVFYQKDLKLMGNGYIVGTVAYTLNINSQILTSLILVADRDVLAAYYSLAENKNWIMSNSMDALIVSKPINEILKDIGDKFKGKIVINTDSFIELNELDYYRKDNETSLRNLGYNVYIKKLSYTQMSSIKDKLDKLQK